MTTSEKLSTMTDKELRAYLFSDDWSKKSFFQATADYMQAITETEAVSVSNASQTMHAETEAQDHVTTMTKTVGDDVVKEIDEEIKMAKHSGMPKWLTITTDVFMIAAALATMNPFIIGMTVLAVTLQASGAMNKMENAACGDDPSKRAAFEFGFAAGEAALSGGAGAMSGMTAASTAAAQAAKTAVDVTVQMVKNMIKYALTYLPQALAMDNFWADFAKGPLKMGDEGAMIFGTIMGVSSGIATSVAASSTEDALTQSIRNYVLRNATAQNIFRYVTTTLNLAGDGFTLAGGVESVKAGNARLKLADYLHDVVAGTNSDFSLIQNLVGGINAMITQTNDTLKTVVQDGTAETQTFSSYAEMFRKAE